MGYLRDKMDADLLLQGLSDNTRASYLQCVRRLARHCRCSPNKLGRTEIKEFFLYLKNANKSPATINVYRGAVKFLFEVTLLRPYVVDKLGKSKVVAKLPMVLS